METTTLQAMKISLGRMVILVEDYDEALLFYKNVLNARVLHDDITPHGQRYLHIGFDEADTSGIWFLKAENPREQSRVGKQTDGQPAFVLYTESLDVVYKRLLEHAVQIVKEPVVMADYQFLHFRDLYGNEIIVVQMKS
ncbi:bleomycin resistance protein [Chryseolinea soli]|uniref:Bleomycin resistance protein n=2 Tax=Chryseolinea soli TaxID=2321403 RepID=A0A385SPG0_9BACT|nr:bleomycin resistance protein [Chryseolinea soli]